MARNNFNARMLELIEEEDDDDYGILFGMAAVEGEQLAIESRGPRRGRSVPCHATIDRDRAKVIAIFGEEYLRSPNSDNITRLLATGEQRGFPCMLGSIDCMHWKWKNCPSMWAGMYSGHVHEPTIILEVVVSEGRAPPVNYSINSHDYSVGYYLADGIYPSWETFVKTISALQGNKRKLFANAQESAQKDVERAFGVLQACFTIVCGPARFWNQETLKDIMIACIIMHNMIIEDEQDAYNMFSSFEAC
ncbi:hypothetical protein Dsin_030394 [Dipteronia sinensis]|uniref:Uncharacterized protein n=1 Tax=Dipteronia sinensis TaxID=43782 RepID=A0AAE0DR33_9ROSI|nr:hypothetical protein Dsin_030394 [Dipteronia sinensis]